MTVPGHTHSEAAYLDTRVTRPSASHPTPPGRPRHPRPQTIHWYTSLSPYGTRITVFTISRYQSGITTFLIKIGLVWESGMEKWYCHILIFLTTAKLIVQTWWGSLHAKVRTYSSQQV